MRHNSGFDASPLRVLSLFAGFPCQDISLAGEDAGNDKPTTGDEVTALRAELEQATQQINRQAGWKQRAERAEAELADMTTLRDWWKTELERVQGEAFREPASETKDQNHA